MPPLPDLQDISITDWRRFTETPRRYGFHATQKPPFRLTKSCSETGIVDSLRDFCRQQSPVPLGSLEPRAIGNFLALVPASRNYQLSHFARDCVLAFEGFRAPLTAQEIETRNHDRLTPRQRAFLERWGYPYVFSEFRFHMTLTGPLEEVDREACRREVLRLASQTLAEAQWLDQLCLFSQASPQSDFRVLEAFPLGTVI